MTTLLDGYLETDDPVVAAPFGGKAVMAWRSDFPEQKPVSGELSSIIFNDLPFIIYVKEANCEYENDRIRIPASIVAEVTGRTTGNAYDNTAFIIINHLTMSAKRAYQLVPWLRKHTQETPDV